MNLFLQNWVSFPKFILSSILLLSCLFGTAQTQDCTGATGLTSNTSCSLTSSSISGATATAGVPAGCIAGTHYDYWFSFTAVTSSHTVTINNTGNKFTNPEVQLFSGGCGALVSLGCGTTSVTATGLTTGNTYYIRVSQVGGSAPGNPGTFTIC